MLFSSVSRFLPGAASTQQTYSALQIDEKDIPLRESHDDTELRDGAPAAVARPRRLGQAFIIYVALSMAVMVYLAVAAFTPSKVVTEPTFLKQPCGTSAAEARERGCHFDMIEFAWLPDECYDAELTAEFRNFTTWGYWLDKARQHPVPLEDALSGEMSNLYTEFEYHLRHCTFLWRKMHRALLGHGKMAIDSVSAKYDHTRHCEEMLMNWRDVDLDELNSIIVLKFPDCGVQ